MPCGCYDSFGGYVSAPIGRPKRDRKKAKAQRSSRKRNR